MLLRSEPLTMPYILFIETNKRHHSHYLATAVTDTKKDNTKTAAAIAAAAAHREQKRGAAAAAPPGNGNADEPEEEVNDHVDVGVEGKDIKQVMTKLAEVDGIVAGLRQRMKDREVATGEMDYYRAKVGKLRREYELQQKLRMEGKIRVIPPKDISRLERNEAHLRESTERWNRTNNILITDLNFVWNKR
jgi:hypothetical protein